MKNTTFGTFSILAYKTAVRDTLEYTISRDKYSLEAFNGRKNIIKKELEVKSPLANFLTNEKNLESGEKLINRINDLHDKIYGEEGGVIKVAGEEIRVDHAQHIVIFENVMPVMEELKNVLMVHANHLRNEKLMEESFEKLLALDERFYRGLSYLTLFLEFQKLYSEYAKARQEAKGEKTPQSNFIEKDISNVVSLFALVRSRATIQDNEYWDVTDKLFKLLDITSGRREMPKDGKLNDMFTEVKNDISQYTNKYEQQWNEQYRKLYTEFIELNEQIKAQKGAQTMGGDA